MIVNKLQHGDTMINSKERCKSTANKIPTMDEVETKKYLTINEASVFTNLKVSKLRDLVFRNSIPVIRIDGILRFCKKDLESWINQSKKYTLN